MFCFVEKKGETGILPAKSVFLLLKRLFYGVSLDENSDSISYTSIVTVNNGLTFVSTSRTSQYHARNLASIQALGHLCAVENRFSNRFLQPKHNDRFPLDFADEIQKYIDDRIVHMKNIYVITISMVFRLIQDAFQYRAPQVDLKNKSNVLAGIVQTERNDISTAKVVLLSSGTKNIDANALYAEHANLPDTHAEVVARRCLMHYFYEQIDMFLQPGL